MRRRLNLLVLAVTSLVVIAFVIPLGLLVRRQADQRGRIEAERTAQALAAVVVRLVAGADGVVSAADLAAAIGSLPEASLIILPGGEQIGIGEPNAGLVADVMASQRTLSAYEASGFGVAIPVITRSGVVVVYSSVPAEELVRGVRAAWILLAGLGVGLVIASLTVADRLGRAVVGPSRRIAEAAELLGSGNLDTRVNEEGPTELMAIASAFNLLAKRIRGLLTAEREQVADLSHRLRTPLTALQLQAEQMKDPDERDLILDKTDRLRKAVDDLISQARRRPTEGPARSDLKEVVRSKARFWQVLADEQDRKMTMTLTHGPATVAVPEHEVGAAIDVLIGNVFSHTAVGVPFRITVRRTEGELELEVGDQGQGFPADLDPIRRGVSGHGSSGLGLDIVQQLAERAGGTLRIGNAPDGGATVVIRIPDAALAADS